MYRANSSTLKTTRRGGRYPSMSRRHFVINSFHEHTMEARTVDKQELPETLCIWHTEFGSPRKRGEQSTARTVGFDNMIVGR